MDIHGSSARYLADMVPAIYLDFGNKDNIIGLNVLDNVLDPHITATQITSAFEAIYRNSWGPRLAWLLYNCIRLAIDNQKNLTDIYYILTDKSFRDACVANASFKDFWNGEFEEIKKAQGIEAVLNKVGLLCADPTLRNIFSQTTINLEAAINRGERIIINLNRSVLGQEPAQLLGSLIVSTITSAAMKRNPDDVSVGDVPVCHFIIDEFQNFATAEFIRILSEARKYGLFLVTMHQYLEQVPQEIMDAVLANAGYFVAFRASVKDAPTLAQRLDRPVSDLLELPKYEALVKNGLMPWRMHVLPPEARRGRLEANQRLTRDRYSRPIPWLLQRKVR